MPGASEADAGRSPASLLWAYQLRRENRALVSKTDEIEKRFSASAEAARATNDSTIARLERLEALIGGLRDEICAIKGTVSLLVQSKEGDDTLRDERERRERDDALEWREKLKQEIGEEVRRLETALQEFREEIDRKGKIITIDYSLALYSIS
jgi:hypothetical protein